MTQRNLENINLAKTAKLLAGFIDKINLTKILTLLKYFYYEISANPNTADSTSQWLLT